MEPEDKMRYEKLLIKIWDLCQIAEEDDDGFLKAKDVQGLIDEFWGEGE